MRSVGVLARDLAVFWAGLLGQLLTLALGPAIRAFERWFLRFAARYERILNWSLDHRGRVMAVAGAALGLALALGALLERDLLPAVDQGEFTVRLELPEGSSLAATDSVGRDVEAALLAEPGIEAVFSRVGRDVSPYAREDEASGLNTAELRVRLVAGISTAEALARLSPLAEEAGGAELTFEAGQASALGQILGGAEADVAVRVRGEDLERTYTRAQEVRERLGRLGRLRNVRIGTERGQPEVQIGIDRLAAARHRIEPRRIAEEVNRAMRGEAATQFVDFDRRIDVVVRYPERLRHSLETLSDIRIQGVALRELIDVREVLSVAEIRREDQGRVVPVYADVGSGGLDRAISDIGVALADLPPTRELRMDVGGENEEMRRSFRDLGFAFALALVLVYMILAAQFESFVHPFTILAAVPLALVGSILALALAGQGINTMSLIGMVILVGIVVNDSIVKVDFINQARRSGAELRAAILEAGRLRLRPIVMTTATTVLGLTPMALGIGRGADLRAPLAVAVIGGLTVATALTLVVVPVVYSLVESVRESVRPAGGGVDVKEAGP